MPPPILSLTGIRKIFGSFTALDGVDFTVYAGEVVALMGENGAGKSTLIKVLTGVLAIDGGKIVFDGQEIHPRSPDDAVRLGISTVYQEVNLAPNLSVAENICIGREPKGPFGIKWPELRRRAEKALAGVGISIDVRRPVGSLSIALQQMVSIARALDVSAKVIVLDEPTSSLDRSEVEQLFSVIRRLREQGMGIVFVTHFLDQVYEMSDRITVLRNGKLIGSWATAELSRLQLVSHMIGRDASALERTAAVREEVSGSSEIASATAINRAGAAQNVNFKISGGQVLGIAGLLGSGRTEVMRMVFGLDAPDSGEIRLKGRNYSKLSPRQAIRAGLGICSEDRKVEGIFPELSIRENILIAHQAKLGWHRLFPMAQQKKLATDMAERLKVQPPDIERPIGLLSGGNQQKALLARWMMVKPDLLLLDEPTRGIDVGAKFEIMELVEKLREDGMAFMLISSELSEVVRASTQVLIMRDGKQVQTLDSASVTEENVVNAIAEHRA